MIVEKHSNLLMAAGYPFLMMIPFHCLRSLVSSFWTIPEDPSFTPWWQSAAIRGDLLGTHPLDQNFSWISVFQNHDFILFQHCIALLSIYFAYVLVRKYFGFYVALLFTLLYGLSPLSLEWPSCSLPEWLQGALLVFWLYIADRSRTESFRKKLFLHGILGILCALQFLVKYNALPVVLFLFVGLLAIDWKGYLKAAYSLISFSAALACFIGFFIFSYHLPTTGTPVLSMNSWVLANKCFEFIPEPTLSMDTGIHSKRILAMYGNLPKNNAKVFSPAPYFQSLEYNNKERVPYQQNLLWILKANDQQLTDSLISRDIDPITYHDPILSIAYYIGLQEYSDLLSGMYKDLVIKYPFRFLQDTTQNFFRSFALKENSYLFRPNWGEVQLGRDLKAPSHFGFVKFQWPSERHICYHENIVWLPGVWFFTKFQSLWPSTRWIWLLAFFAFLEALKNLTYGHKNEQSILVTYLFITTLLFIGFSNCIYIEFRLKEFEYIRLFATLFAAIGICQGILVFQKLIRGLSYRYKTFKIGEFYEA
ncbi:MAG TPA: hypothetical protein VLE96_03295 [Chlamydiales bacterium]|nr:hypothetical protein [Chlamydiales bacterium]